MKLRQAAAWPEAAAAQADIPLFAVKPADLAVLAGKEVLSAHKAEASSSSS